MIYCDLTVNGQPVWFGVPCLGGVSLKSEAYLGFIGDLIFTDLQGTGDPTFDGLGSRFPLLYYGDQALSPVIVPLQAVPAQQFSIVLNGQNCILSFYYKTTPCFRVVYANNYARGYYQGAC
jgi:hypothetical protein